MTNFVKRTIFGTLYVALVVTSLLLLQPYYFGFVFLLLSMGSVREFHRITHSDMFLTVSGVVLSGLLFCGLWTWMTSTAIVFASTYWILLIYFALLLVAIVAELFRKAENPIRNWGLLFTGQVMVALPFALMVLIFDEAPMLLLALFVIIWLNDSGAYCVGSLLGRHKMIPRVSPGKTWEGLIGGMLVALAVGYVFLADPFGFTGLSYTAWQALLVSFFIVVFGTLGDLMESLLKRTLGIKDSGNVLPGHGGFLDRFDSVLFATYAVAFLLAVM
ncbi:MAG: phosphatidate cytidylyltransferase [Bacteroidales bacterium]|nr:phosphatidate cytidylyltransferase [Bacteroidales bacterium]